MSNFGKLIQESRTILDEAELDTAARDKIKKGEFAFPRLKKLPIHDAAHVRNAMARFNQTQGMSPAEKSTAYRKIVAAAHRLGVDVEDFKKRKSK